MQFTIKVFSFYIVPSSEKNKDALVHWSEVCRNIFMNLFAEEFECAKKWMDMMKPRILWPTSRRLSSKKSFKFGQKWLFVGRAKIASEQPRNCGFKSRQWYFKPTHVPKKGSSCGSVGRAVSSVNRGTRVQIEL